MLYREYVRVDADFIPVFSQENDKAHQHAWKSFIPHESIRRIVQDLIAALSGERQENRKALWMTGAFGTGKTYAAFLIKHLLEDDLSEVKTWFDKYPPVQSLWAEFSALRLNKKIIVPVFKSASAMVRDDTRLFMEIQSAVKNSLRAKGFAKTDAATLRDMVIGELLNAESTFNFDAAIRKYPQEFPIGATADMIRAHVNANPEDTSILMNILHVMEKEGRYLISGPEEMKAWLADIIRQNKVDAIVLIWDEFTDYFRNNNAVSSLQELAHASASIPFFLFLITHRDLEQFGAMDAEARRVLRNRFYMHNLAMNDLTSYQLMGNAILPVERNKTVWENKRDTLWDIQPVLLSER